MMKMVGMVLVALPIAVFLRCATADDGHESRLREAQAYAEKKCHDALDSLMRITFVATELEVPEEKVQEYVEQRLIKVQAHAEVIAANRRYVQYIFNDSERASEKPGDAVIAACRAHFFDHQNYPGLKQGEGNFHAPSKRLQGSV